MTFIGIGLHPDRESSGFAPSQGWCVHCSQVIRVVGTRYYSSGGDGPYCSSVCMVKAMEAKR